MPSTTPCVQCGVVGNVRWERVLTGSLMFVEYYCGRCQHIWRVDADDRPSTQGAPPNKKPERSRASVLPECSPRRERWQ
jgi:hypothetical protein